MCFFKCFKANNTYDTEIEGMIDNTDNEEELYISDQVKLVYFSCTPSPDQDLINILNSLTKDTNIETFTSENKCIEYINSITTKLFLIIDDSPTNILIELIEPMKHIDSLFIYSSSSSSSSSVVNQNEHSYIINLCRDKKELMNSIQKSYEALDKQLGTFTIYNKEEKFMRDLSKDGGSFLYFQLFLNLLKYLPKTDEARNCMIRICRNYYRGNFNELKNIEEFDRTYRSIDAITWYTKDIFISKFINKIFRTENVDVLSQFSFYINDLSEQLQLKFLEFKQKQKGVVKLYQSLELNNNELIYFQNNIGNIISPNGYILTTNERSIAHDFLIKSAKKEDVARVLFQYEIDLYVVEKIVLADIREYSSCPEVLIDIGASFQIDSCQFNNEEDLWYIKVHAIDYSIPSAVQYIEYHKREMTQSNIVLMLGNLLIEMGEYTKAERYFVTILNSSNLNDEELACLFFYFGRISRLQGDFNRGIDSYNRAYKLHMNARPKRSASAGKALNGLGVIFNEQGKELKAEEYFQRAMKLYKKSLPKKHLDIAATLINLGTIDCDRQDYDRALVKYLRAKKIYDYSLPATHPSFALLKINLGNLYLAMGDYENAYKQYDSALKIQESSLPNNHPDIVRTLHNLAVVQTHRGINDQAKQYLERAEEIASKTLLSELPVMNLLAKTNDFMVEYVYD
ncbi:unnamed protein product [Adineta steineri]|uniref:Kinesin light chain n=1 Tax=Adineta steineri TaxID=433720 RepID=A0A815MGJ6_9BILA|nr:unnamed protein product [Adineta steineri]